MANPLLRKDFISIAESIANIDGIRQLAVTTNGYRMAKDVAAWKKAGITSINVSVDSLDPKMFHQITGINKFDDVMRGIDRAFEVGYNKVKVNSVLMKNLNDKEFEQFLVWVKIAQFKCVLSNSCKRAKWIVSLINSIFQDKY